jgi:hypothetical protein
VNDPNSRRRRVALAGVTTLLLLSGGAAPAFAGPERVHFAYAFSGVQQTTWSYDNGQGPSDCGTAPARGSGRQDVRFTASGPRVEVTSDLNRDRRKASFNITRTGTGAFQRQGTFAIAKSQLGGCAEPDVTLGTHGCGADRAPAALVLNLDGGMLEAKGNAEPFVANGEMSCPFMLVTGSSNGFTVRRDPDLGDLQFNGGLLLSSAKVAGRQLFRHRKVVLRGKRTKVDGGDGFTATTTVSWTLTLTPRR